MPRKQAPQQESTAVIPAPGGAVVDWKSRLQARQQQRVEAAQDVATGASPRLIFGSNGIRLNKDGDPQRSLKVVLLATQFYRAYYDSAFDDKNPTGPLCYSLDEQKPHAKAAKPQNATCKDCPWNQFQSHPNGRGGKACAEVARFAAVAPDAFKDDVSKVDPAVAHVSVLNRKQLAKFDAMGPAPETIVQITCKSVKGSDIGYDLEFAATGKLPLNDRVGSALVQLGEMADKKFQEPLPDYKAVEKGKTRKFSTK